MNTAIVIGEEHANTLGLIRSLGVKGIKPVVYLLTKKKVPGIIRSKYISHIELFASLNDIYDRLKIEAEHIKGKAILYASSDSVSAFIDSHYSDLIENYVFFNAENSLRSWMNKENMNLLASKIGFNVPTHFVYKLGDALPDNIVYPCITKAISSIDGDKSNTAICYNEYELETFLSKTAVCETIQIQTFIDKEIEFQLIGVSINKGEKVVIPGHSHIVRPKGIQNVFYFEYISNDCSFMDVLHKAEIFIKDIGYSGIFSMEFLRGKDGKDYFLEMNFRNDGNAICVTDAGYNLPYIWYLWATNDDYLKEIDESVFRDVRYFPEIEYSISCAKGEVTIISYFQNLFCSNSFRYYFKGDSPWYYWISFSAYMVKQLLVKKVLIKLGLL